METLDIVLFPTIIVTLLFFLSVVKIISLKKENRQLSGKLDETTISLDLTKKELAKIEHSHATTEKFQSSLDYAKHESKLQSSFSRQVSSSQNSNAPEKYSYIHSLIKKGLSAEEIGSVLAISPCEARQLVTLSEIAAVN